MACFTAGSRIAPPEGPQPLTELRPGDLVLTLDRGPCPVRDVLTTDLDHATLARRPELRPVVVDPSALGPGRPDRRMHLSPQPWVLMQADGREVLVHARHLAEELGLARIQNRRPNPLHYIHLLMAPHALVQVDGVWSESFHAGPEMLRMPGLARRLGAKGLVAPCSARVRPLLPRADLRRADAVTPCDRSEAGQDPRPPVAGHDRQASPG
ncbi:Hint domain-containing protein [Rhodovulum kholense]|uniref:Hint domain-containing protein n=1 Tax=Rhodovulum kholense TaxID=453584 RepID=A0A8E2VLH7_9RHOB|nr:Hint domain-containing protein [Rhodovulum kholense]PTW51211.1 Hint domain-containing protein [Rhodovulum kholense]